MGTLYYGDNLEILTRYIADESVDLVYLDPPFNSAQDYNAFFEEKDGTSAASQIQAFKDTWEWNNESHTAYEALSLRADKLGSVMRAFMEILGPTDMMAYLAMMAPRLVELHRALKPTGSLYRALRPHGLALFKAAAGWGFWSGLVSLGDHLEKDERPFRLEAVGTCA